MPDTPMPHATPHHSEDQLPVAVIGCGRMGKLHARVYSQMPGVRLVGVYDVDPEKAADVAGEFHCLPFHHIDELLPEVKAVTIAVPTPFHAATARPCLEHGLACLIEKPLARDAAEARGIVELARTYGGLVQVGHIERFNPVIRAVSRLNIRPGFIEVARISPMTFRGIDVGVVLDMMIHDIDIVLKLAQSKVRTIDAVGVSVIGDVEDVCNARVTFESGCVANLTASRMALKTERKMRIFSADAYVSLDYQKRYGIVAQRRGNVDAIRDTVAQIRSGEIHDLSEVNYADLVHIEELKIDDIEPLRAQLDAFVQSVTTHAPPQVSAEEGLAAVELAERIVQAIGPDRKLS